MLYGTRLHSFCHVSCIQMHACALLGLVALVAAANGASLETRVVAESCGKKTMEPGDRLMIQSPNFPRPYSNSYRCV